MRLLLLLLLPLSRAITLPVGPVEEAVMQDTAVLEYDACLVGLGTAGVTVLASILRDMPHLRVIALEFGGPLSGKFGGTDYDWAAQSASEKMTKFDVPGMYETIARDKSYKIGTSGFTFQGKGVGGNSEFNGMLFMTPEQSYFDDHFPDGWKWKDMQAYFEQTRQALTPTNKPSADGKMPPRLQAAVVVMDLLYRNLSVSTVDISQPGQVGLNSPFVAVEHGERSGPVHRWGSELFDAAGQPLHDNLKVVYYAQVTRIEIDENTKRASSVLYSQRTGNDEQQPATQEQASLSDSGIVILAAGAVNTPRLLMLSDVGPAGKESSMGADLSFKYSNSNIGKLYDHVGAKIVLAYNGPVDFESFSSGDLDANQDQLKQYFEHRTGAYCVYGPVHLFEACVAPIENTHKPEPNRKCKIQAPNVEYFTTPHGLPTNTRSVSVYAMLFKPEARGEINLDGQWNTVKYPNMYLSAEGEYAAGAQRDLHLLASAIYDLLQWAQRDPHFTIVSGPGSASHPGLSPDSFDDIVKYVKEGGKYSRLIMNHFGGSVPLAAQNSQSAVDPVTMAVKYADQSNIHVVDASLLPLTEAIPAHPVATVVAMALHAADQLKAVLKNPTRPPSNATTLAPTTATPTSRPPAPSNKTTPSPTKPPPAKPTPPPTPPPTPTPNNSTASPTQSSTSFWQSTAGSVVVIIASMVAATVFFGGILCCQRIAKSRDSRQHSDPLVPDA